MNNFKFRLLTKHTKWVFILMMFLFSSGAYAQGGSTDNATLLVAVIVVGVVAILVLFVSIYTLQVLNIVIKSEAERKAKEAGVEAKPELTLWQKFLKVANRRVDADKEETIILDHNYDGIRELDNHLPPWWNYLFYLTIVFGIFYVILYHVTDTFPLQEEAYENEMAEAAASAEMRMAENQASGNAFSEADLELTTDPDILASGSKIFAQQCAVCHKADGGGSIGPNLTDDYWLHGGDIKSIYTTIRVGVPDKGMISWEAMLSPTQIRDVANYIKSLRGTNPPGAKAPQGELYEEGAENEGAHAAEMAGESDAGTTADLEEAKNAFLTVCAACHLADGGGLIGPNLTDKYWKDSDGSFEGIKKTITEGVAGTTMVSWKTSYSEEQIDALANYILSLQGTTPATPKAPEGDLIE
jgi:cytochrome c oxidase cbb3-type subunit III